MKLADEAYSDLPIDVMPVDEILEACQEAKMKHFLDLNFPPCDASLWDNATNPESPFPEAIEWRRPKDIWKGENIKVFGGGIDPNDINQGALGDCWFLSSMAAVAENPDLV